MVGNEAFLGSWSIDRAVPMTWSDGNVWSCVLCAPRGEWPNRTASRFVICEGVEISIANPGRAARFLWAEDDV